MITTCALNEPRPVGSTLDAGPFGRVRITAEISKDEFFEDLEQRRRRDRECGLPPARAGTFMDETREWVPTREVPAELKYFYRVEPL